MENFRFEKGFDVTRYPCDILSKKDFKVLPNTMTIGEVIDYTIYYKCQIITQSTHGDHQGSWHIKAPKQEFGYDFLKDLLSHGSEKKQTIRRNTFLLKY